MLNRVSFHSAFQPLDLAVTYAMKDSQVAEVTCSKPISILHQPVNPCWRRVFDIDRLQDALRDGTGKSAFSDPARPIELQAHEV